MAEALFGPSFPFVRVLRLEDNAGKGAAIRHGTAAASAPVVLFIDVDMSVDPSQIPRLVEAVESADVAIGTRSVAGSVVESCSMHRKLMGRTFNLMVRRLTSVPFRRHAVWFQGVPNAGGTLIVSPHERRALCLRRGGAVAGAPVANGHRAGGNPLAGDGREQGAPPSLTRS